MAILKFRVYYEEDDSIYRDIAIKHTQTFYDFCNTLLKSFEFDNKHGATFYRSNDNWQRGREITLEIQDKKYPVPPLLMKETTIGSEIQDHNQKFIFVYDFNRQWTFLVELINVSKEEKPGLEYPAIVRTEGIGPSQYGTRGIGGDKLAEMEEKYDLNKGILDGFGEEGEEDSDGGFDDYQDDEEL